MVRSLLLGPRWQLGEWKNPNENAINIDVPSSTMKVRDEIVATVYIEEDKLMILRHDETLKEWRELQDSDEMKELFDMGNKKLKQAA